MISEVQVTNLHRCGPAADSALAISPLAHHQPCALTFLTRLDIPKPPPSKPQEAMVKQVAKVHLAVLCPIRF